MTGTDAADDAEGVGDGGKIVITDQDILDGLEMFARFLAGGEGGGE